jgi:hypothetical protein
MPSYLRFLYVELICPYLIAVGSSGEGCYATPVDLSTEVRAFAF